jgi:hypothetical protein
MNTFSIYACHPCAGAMLIFSVSFQLLLEAIPLREAKAVQIWSVLIRTTPGHSWINRLFTFFFNHKQIIPMFNLMTSSLQSYFISMRRGQFANSKLWNPKGQK